MKSGEVVLEVEGMTCEACETHAHEALEAVQGVEKVCHVDLSSKEANVMGDERLSPAALLSAVERAGYRGKVLRSGEEDPGADCGEAYDLLVLGGGSAAFAAPKRRCPTARAADGR